MTTTCDLDLHRLDLRFGATRLVEPSEVTRFVRSIECCGQIVPCTVVEGSGDAQLLLVDGYRRVAALRRLGRDTVRVELWRCDPAEALIGVLARTDGRSFAAIEEALQLRHLVQDFGLSQHELADRCGRNASWVNRRLKLLSALPESALAAIRQGWLSSWSASRILVPLARANTDHAEQLLAALQRTPLSSRDLVRWFKHYEQASKAVRARMVEQPRLFLSAVEETDANRAADRLRAGPEGACAADLKQIEAGLARLRTRLACLRPVPALVRQAIPRLRAAVNALLTGIESDDEDSDRGADDGAHAACKRADAARHQQNAVDVP